jgi:uncharacterized protein (DUF302 family)
MTPRSRLPSLLVTLSLIAGLGAAPVVLAAPAPAPAATSGVIRVASAYGVDETVRRLKADIDTKGIKFFSETDQSALAAGTDIKVNRSVLLQFGNPPLGLQFLTASPYAGLDWPVRMVVFEDGDRHVWVAYTDFDYIAKRHAITTRDPQFRMASEVAASIASSVTK